MRDFFASAQLSALLSAAHGVLLKSSDGIFSRTYPSSPSSWLAPVPQPSSLDDDRRPVANRVLLPPLFVGEVRRQVQRIIWPPRDFAVWAYIFGRGHEPRPPSIRYTSFAGTPNQRGTGSPARRPPRNQIDINPMLQLVGVGAGERVQDVGVLGASGE